MTAKHHRVESLDAFRGVTIAGMILVNNPGNWDAVYAPLVHADWNGWTFADLVFPFFVVILGVALPFALARRRASGHQLHQVYRRIARRFVLLVGLGLALNFVAAPFSLSTIRIPGVLQRIAIVYAAAALVTLRAGPRARVVIAASLTLVHWAILSLAPLTPGGTISGAIDRAVFGHHLLLAAYDPEGLLGTLSAIASALVGTVAGEWLLAEAKERERALRIAGFGVALAIVGWLWSFALPINKTLWTGSYAALTAGFALLAFAACYAAIDIAGLRSWARPFTWLGVNPLAIYFLAELVAHLLDLTGLKSTIYWDLLHPATVGRLSGSFTSLMFAVVTVTVWISVAGLLYRRGVRVQV